MSPRFGKILPAIAAACLSNAAWGQNYQELSATVSGPWHHVPDPRGALDFNREMAKCQVVSAQTPVDSTTPAVVEIVRWRVVINCLKASGYEPGVGIKDRSRPDTTATSAKIAAATCLNFSNLRKLPGDAGTLADLMFFSWTQGYVTAWNIAAQKPILRVDPAAITPNEQQKILQAFCAENPSKRYIEAVIALMAKLKYEKTRATGNPEEE